MKTPKPRHKVEAALADPISQKITALELKALDLMVEYRRTRTALQNLIDQRTMRGVWGEIFREAIPERRQR